MKNIENFNLCAAHILGKLYEEFPISRKIDPSTVVAELNGAIKADPARDVNANSFVQYTVQWLVDTGYLIRTEGATASKNRYVLAPKAFEALSAPLPNVAAKNESSKSLGERLKEVAVETGKDFSGEGRRQLISQLVRQAFGFAFGT